ncbi:fumarylacetoacetate hydrolase family protein [Kineococcus rubinsiae]|uniref:fumarylacetoacetate hydrolase family protein n=1 Tax=Kineococcus rubinsiae TaxID=2609562 RepID=UPI00142F972F|nr:fumarylacetoacetate hydrolase family protein [Kineococcus rubinsiae]NIZ90589.1 fumarylacetoacetate hydrolase family protein [Kineococcus rubinsiae]
MSTSATGYALGRFSDGTEEFTGLVVDEVVHPLLPGEVVDGPATVPALLEDWDATEPRLQQLAAARRPEQGRSLDGLRVLVPVQPRQVLQAGANYRTHVAELNLAARARGDRRPEEEVRRAVVRSMDERARNGRPFIFAALPSALSGAYDDVVLPPESSQVDWEAELAVVIGAPAHRVSREDAMRHVAGYTVCNDVSARDLQFSAEHRRLGGDWVSAKNRPTFLPTGPWFVPASQVPDHRELRITLDLNGRRMQDEVAGGMLHDVAQLIASASAGARLLPGDLLLTGSPVGNGGYWNRWLRPGDVLETAISGLGAQRTRCVAEVLP